MTRSVPPDYREFVRIAVDLPLNPKLAMIDEPAAGWAYVVSLCYCGQNLTDGTFPRTTVMRLAGVKRGVAKLLVDAGLWHETGHACPRCQQPPAGMAVVHDYLEHQRSAQEARSLRDVRREAGRKGAAKRWAAKVAAEADGKSHSKSQANAMATGWQADGKPMAEVEVEEEIEQKTSSSAARRRAAAVRLPDTWRPSDTHEAQARELGLDLRFEAQQFRAHADANDRRQARWDAAFRQWLGKSAEMRRGRPALRLAAGQHQPFRNPTDDSVYDEPLLPTPGRNP